jgi:hypothetical protein
MKLGIKLMTFMVTLITSKWWTFMKLLRWVQFFNRSMDLDEILYGGDDIEDDLNAIPSNPIASTVLKWQTFKLLSCVLLLNTCVS